MFISSRIQNYARLPLSALALLAITLLSGCSSVYVDTATKEIPVAEFTKPATPKPVQVVFEFQTKGVPNPAATDYLKGQVLDQAIASGLFEVKATSADKGTGLLNITLNNIPLTDDAAAKGFATGLTFGLAGTAVTDGYVCTVSYLPAAQSDAVQGTSRHAIHTVIGNAKAPENAVKSASIDIAIRTMTREILSNAFNALSKDDKFKQAAPQ
ncbi:hypothetical protein IGB42_03315 [Andreprevotia sp. IGB-42]|uniref:hypothetical protein n=1 Tax=Andreprevotia sp. IGB-42 TaxID=2497473 RepID=UPI00157E6E92|nr:hypothetical protein [Andreprevotia sp. IGB-42]KAF0812325.1 hypothetical protein IGB42_03315 [Andreprevotia sp. IGB-42]